MAHANLPKCQKKTTLPSLLSCSDTSEDCEESIVVEESDSESEPDMETVAII